MSAIALGTLLPPTNFYRPKHNCFVKLSQWADFCKSLLVEAKWFSLGYTPSLEEYLENARVTSSGPLILTHAVLFIANGNLDIAEDLFESQRDLIYQSSLIIRICNDLGTSEVYIYFFPINISMKVSSLLLQ